jgi:glyoxylase-like metal-dependent hydrolase (beta-lactamase superfamily II)
MIPWICVTCGTQFSPSDNPPEVCPICQDERQYVGYQGQHWTTLEDMKAKAYKNAFHEHEPNLIGIGTFPEFGIGQRALLVRTPDGNILWDCITYIDDITTDLIRGIGGIKAITISHPHYYSAMVEWANRFDCPIYLHKNDREWVMRPSDRIEFWEGNELQLTSETKLIHVGGHFAGGTVLHWGSGANGKGALLTGDILQVVADRHWVSFMYSYPNAIPLPAREIERIKSILEPLEFERIYGFKFDRIVQEDAKASVIRSADRYIRALH